MTEQAKTIDEIRKLSVEKLAKALPALDRGQLEALKTAELAEGEGKTRSTAIEAIDARLGEIAEEEAAAAAKAETDKQPHPQPLPQAGGGEGPDDEEDAGVNDVGAHLVFIDGDKPIAGLPELPVTMADFIDRGGRGLLKRAVDLSPHGPPCRITSVRLVTPAGERDCPIPGGLVAGGGRAARFPAESLIF